MLKISLDQNSDSFAPNDRINGKIHWHEIGAESASIEIRLLWHTLGKGTLDMKVVSSIVVPTPGISGSHAFQFVTPHRPFSFSGKLVSLIWSIEAIVFPSLETERVDLVISNSGSEIILHDNAIVADKERID